MPVIEETKAVVVSLDKVEMETNEQLSNHNPRKSNAKTYA
jgi:hypothetical protein